VPLASAPVSTAPKGAPPPAALSSTTPAGQAWPPAGVRIGGYIVQRPIARGGMGQVVLAHDETLQRAVALKVLARADADDEARARFLREARALARVEHPGVVRVLASGDDDGVAWMALDYIEGDSLTALCGGGPIDEETAVALLAQVARGLAAVHAVGVVHRDVKPDNLLVDGEANVKIVDFGVAFVDGGSGGFTTRAGVVVGTPHFMSPEQARGGAVDARSDAWSLGATLWWLLVGRPPFAGGGDDAAADLDILARVVRDPLPDLGALAPATSPATRALVSSLLAKDPAARPDDLAVVAAALDDIAGALARGAVPPAAPPVVAGSAPSPASSAAPSSSATGPALAAPSVPVREGRSTGAVVAVVVGLGLVVAAVAGGVVVGRRTAEPRVQERVVERVVTVEVPVPTPVPALSADTAKPPPPPPPPTADQWRQELASASPAELPVTVDRVLAQNDAAARAALVAVAGAAGEAGDVVVERALFDDRVDRAALIDAALRTPARALRIVEQLARRRDDTAFTRLRQIAATHGDAKVRAAAARARDSIFSAADETP